MTTYQKAKAPYRVRYRPGNSDENALLRLALMKEWGERCYHCTTPATFVGTEIDHILPLTLPKTEVDAYKSQYLTPERAEDFDLNVAHNLAPICRRCNSDKSNSNFAEVPALATWLNKAHEKRPAVEKFVMGLRSASRVQQSMGKLLGADLSATKSQECLAMLGPALIDRFRSEAPGVLQGLSTHQYGGDYSSDVADDHPRMFADPLVASVILDEGSRRAKVVLEDVFGWNFDRALDLVVEAAAPEINRELAGQIASDVSRGGHEDAEVGTVDGFLSLAIDEIRYDADDGYFVVRGSFEADGSAHVAVVDYQNDSGTQWQQWDADLTRGSFEVPIWEPNAEEKRDGAMAITGDVELGEQKALPG